MKTRTKLFTAILLISLFISYSGFTQESKTDYQMAYLVYIDVNVGSEKDFEEAAIEHNEKYHNEVPNKGYLSQIISGSDAGTYVWVLTPCTFTDMGNMNLGEDHDKHWESKVVPYIKSYGAQEYWKLNDKLSYNDNYDPEHKLSNIWIIDIKRGDSYRFKALMKKIVEAYNKKESGVMRVYDNSFGGTEGRDVAIVWDIKNMAAMDMDDGGIKGEFEEINGEGSWDSMLDEWEEITVSINSVLWRANISK